MERRLSGARPPGRGVRTAVALAVLLWVGAGAGQELAPRAPTDPAELLEALQACDRAERNAAFRTLLQMGRQAEPVLLQALDLSNSTVQALALQMLAELGVRTAVAPALRLLGGTDPTLERAAVAALGALREPRAVQPLLEKLAQTKRASFGCDVMGSLGRIGDHRAIPYLLPRLGSGEPLQRACAAGALGALGDGRGLEIALELAASDEPTTARAAIDALGELADARAAPLLARFAEEPEGKNRPAALLALRRIEMRDKPKKEQLRLLARALEEGERVQGWAARELGNRGDTEAVAALQAHLRAPDGRPRAPILVQLYRLGVPVE